MPQPARGDRADPHRQQRVGQRADDPGWHEPGHPAGRQERREPGERDAAEQDQVHGQPRLAAENRGQHGDHRDVGRRARGRADAHGVEALEVLLPQAGHAAPGGHQRAAAQRRAAEQRALGDQGDDGERDEEQHARVGEHALHQAAVDEQRVVVGRVFARVVAADRLGTLRLGHDVDRVLAEHPERPAGGQVGRGEAAVGGLPARGPLPPGGPQPERVPGHRGIGGQFVQGRARALDEQEEERAQGGQHQVAGQRGEHRPGRQVARQDQQRVAAVLAPGVGCRGRLAPVPGGGLDVVDHGFGDHPHLVAGRLNPPAEVGVLTEQPHARVEPADLLPHVAASQHPGAAHGEDIAVPVVLALIGLARLNAGDPAAGPVDGQARLEQHLAVGPVADLRPEHRGGGRLRRPGQQAFERVRGRLAVVVQQPHPLGPLLPRPAR